MNYYQNPYYYQQPNNLLGKVVESEEIVKISELIPGQVGFYPKADGSCIYVKKWCNNATTQIIKYIPEVPAPIVDPYSDALSSIQSSINNLTKMLTPKKEETKNVK